MSEHDEFVKRHALVAAQWRGLLSEVQAVSELPAPDGMPEAFASQLAVLADTICMIATKLGTRDYWVTSEDLTMRLPDSIGGLIHSCRNPRKAGGSAMKREEELTVSVHPDDEAVDRFAAAMKAKLAKKRDDGRGGWDNPDECSIAFLSELLRDHVAKGDPVDVANFAMMIHQRGGIIE